MAQGYDIGLAASTTSTSGATNNSAFNVQGGGGSLSPAGSARTNWIPWIIGGAIVLLSLWLAFRRH
jgi:hypothetical protein